MQGCISVVKTMDGRERPLAPTKRENKKPVFHLIGIPVFYFRVQVEDMEPK